MNPGATTSPSASTTSEPGSAATSGPTPTMRPASTDTFPRKPGSPLPSTIVAPLISIPPAYVSGRTPPPGTRPRGCASTGGPRRHRGRWCRPPEPADGVEPVPAGLHEPERPVGRDPREPVRQRVAHVAGRIGEHGG